MTSPSTGPDQAETVDMARAVEAEMRRYGLEPDHCLDTASRSIAQAAIIALTEAGAAMPGEAEELRLRYKLARHELDNAMEREQRLRELCGRVEDYTTDSYAEPGLALANDISAILGPPPLTDEERARAEGAVKATFYADVAARGREEATGAPGGPEAYPGEGGEVVEAPGAPGTCESTHDDIPGVTFWRCRKPAGHTGDHSGRLGLPWPNDRTYWVGEHGPTHLTVVDGPDHGTIDWDKATITGKVIHAWQPVAWELLHEDSPALAERIPEAHRDRTHQIALRTPGFDRWHCATCETGGDMTMPGGEK